MSVKRVGSIVLISIMVFIFSGCNKNAEELVIGSFTDGDSGSLSEEKITDKKTIKKVRKILDQSDSHEEGDEGLPNYVVTINNVEKFTMEMLVYFWEQEDGRIIFSGDEDKDSEEGIPDYYVIDQEETKEIKELLGIDE